MKKSLVVLLIAVLAVSSVFAALTGTVTTTAKYNIWPSADGKVIDGEHVQNLDIHTKATVKGAYKFPFAALFGGEEVAGKTDNAGFPYAVVEASLAVEAGDLENDGWVFDDSVKQAKVAGHLAEVKNSAVALDFNNGFTAEKSITFADLSTNAALTLTLDTAKIVGDKWELDFLAGPSVPDFSSVVLSTSNAIGADKCTKGDATLGTCAASAGYKFNSIAKEFGAFDVEIAADFIADYNTVYEASVASAAATLALTDATTARKAAETAASKVGLTALEQYALAEAITEAKKAEATAKTAAENAAKKYSELAAAFETTYDYKFATDTDAIAYTLATAKQAVAQYNMEGIKFTWNTLGSLGIAAKANAQEKFSYFLISLETIPYQFKAYDKLTLQGGLAFEKISTGKLATYMSASAAYADEKLTAKVAADSWVAEKDGDIELNGEFAYDNFLSGSAYYASDAERYDYNWDPKKETHKYAAKTKKFAENFTAFDFKADGTEKAPKFAPVVTITGFATKDQKMIGNWDVTAKYDKYVKANIGMTDALDNLEGQPEYVEAELKGQTLYGYAETTVTDYVDLAGIGKLTAKFGAKDFLDLDTKSTFAYVKDGNPVKTAKESGVYFNVTAEDFAVKGLDFIFSAADLCNRYAQVFALDAAYANDKLTATAGVATGLKNATFKNETTWLYGDVNYKFSDELSAYVGADTLTSKNAHYYVGGKYEKDFTAEARLDINTAEKNPEKAAVGLYAKISTTKLVNGATLALQYGALNSTSGHVATNNLTSKVPNDAITATCEIKF